jgi:glutathione S-transferase
MKTSPDQSVIDAQAPRWNELASILDAQLAKSNFLVGDTVTIADLAVAAPMHLHAASRFPLDKYPNLKRWMTEGIETLPCWQKTQAAVDILVPGGDA